MSREKLPPLSLCTRRERTVIGLKIRHSLRACLEKKSTRPVHAESMYVFTGRPNEFLPDEVSKPTLKKPGQGHGTRGSVHRSYAVNEQDSSDKRRFSDIKILDSSSSLSVDRNTPYRKFPERIAWHRNSTQLIMKLKKQPKIKNISVKTKYPQLHKLGLERSFIRQGSDLPPVLNNGSTPRKDTTSKVDDHSQVSLTSVIQSQQEKRNITQTFRLADKTNKKALCPVQFKLAGLPSPVNNAQRPRRITPVGEKHVSKSYEGVQTEPTDRSVRTVQLGQELRHIVPDAARSKAENRDRYPIFDRTQQRKENTMRERFLDPVLKKCEDKPNGRGIGLPGQRGEDYFMFAPDKEHLELDWKLIEQYRKRLRSTMSGPRGRSPSFSPILNPPPTAMEFNITELESLLIAEQPASPQSTSQSVAGKDDVSQNGGPVVSGTACQPISTAIAHAKTVKLQEAGMKTSDEQIKEDSSVSKAAENTGKLNETVNKNENHASQADDTQKLYNDKVPEVVKQEQVQVIITVIPTVQVSEDEPELSVKRPEIAYGTNKHVYEPSTAFLSVPRIDVSLEGRCPAAQSPSPTEAHVQTTARASLPVVLESSVNEVPKQTEPRVTPRCDNLPQREVSSTNIVFVSPAIATKTEKQ